jgi:16S rRNA C1402 (ribose-2'-O) methylase RsmI
MKLAPQDADAKFNYEFVKRRLEELKQQQQQQNKDQNQDQQDDYREHHQAPDNFAQADIIERFTDTRGYFLFSDAGGRPGIFSPGVNRAEEARHDELLVIPVRGSD